MKTLDDLKREIKDLLLVDSPWFEDELLDAAIDHLASQGRIVPDGYVAVYTTKIPIKKPYTIFHHNELGKTVTIDEQTYRALNKCAVLLDKAMIAAKKGDE